MDVDEPSPKMSYPYSARQIFNGIASLFGERHEECPSLSFEGAYSFVVMSGENYRSTWINVIWPDFRKWWMESTEREKRELADKALSRHIVKGIGFDEIPPDIWREFLELRPRDGDAPFIEDVPER